MTLTKLRQRPSRELFSSGGNEPVADGGAGDHSVFAGARLRALQSMEPAEFAVEELFREVRESVGGRSSQLPQLDPIRNSGHDGGVVRVQPNGRLCPDNVGAITNGCAAIPGAARLAHRPDEGEPEGRIDLRLDSARNVYHGLFAGRRRMLRPGETGASGDDYGWHLDGGNSGDPTGIPTHSGKEPVSRERSFRWKLSIGVKLRAIARQRECDYRRKRNGSMRRGLEPRQADTAISIKSPGTKPTAELSLTK